jgi:hypothetical protein
MRGGFGRLVKMAGEAGAPLSVRDGRVVYRSYGLQDRTFELTRGSTRREVVHDGPVFMLDSDDRGRQTGVWGDNGRLDIGFRTPPHPFAPPVIDRAASALALDVAGSGSVAALWKTEDQPDASKAASPGVFASLRRPGGADFRAPLRIEGGAGVSSTLDIAAGPRGAAVVGAVIGGSGKDEARVFLLPRTGRKVRTLGPVRAYGMRYIRVLRDARGTFLVTATESGLVASWMR